MAYKHFFKRIIQFCYTFSNESSTERKNSTASHRNPKKTTTFAFNKRSVTSMRKCPIVQHVESDSGHSTKRLKRGGTTRICKAVKYNDLHLSPHSVYLSKQRLYRLKWIVTDNQWCKYAASERGFLLPFIHIRRISLGKRIQPHEREQSVQHQQFVSETITIGRNGPGV